MDIIFVLFCISLHICLIFAAKRDVKIFLSILLVNHTYFCLGFYYYWFLHEELYFVGMTWDDSDVMLGIDILSASTVLIALITTIMIDRTPSPNFAGGSSGTNNTANLFLYIGVISCLFVAIFGIGQYDEDSTNNPFLLIAYQCSDFAIPAVVFSVARKPGKNTYFLILLFSIYAVLVGFRYKLAMLYIPLFILMIMNDMSPLRKYLQVAVAAATVLILIFGHDCVQSEFSASPIFLATPANPTICYIISLLKRI